MSLQKVEYVNDQTVITAEQLNAIQDEIITDAQKNETIFNVTLGYIFPEWEQGTASSNSLSDSDVAIRTGLVNVEGFNTIQFIVPDGLTVKMLHYKADGTYASYTTKDIVSGSYATRGNPFVRVVVSRSAAILPHEGKQVLISVPGGYITEALDAARIELDALSTKGETITKSFAKDDLVSGAFIRHADGVAENNSHYLRTDSIAIPSDCEVIVHDFPFSGSGLDGWAVYDTNGTYISGGKDTEFTVPDNAKTIRLSYRGGETADVSITFYPTSAIAISELSKELEDVKAELDALVNKDTAVRQTYTKEELVTGAFIQYADGVVKNNSNYLRTDSITIPNNCKTITHNFPMSETGTDGWAMYDDSGVYISGGKDTMFAVPENARSIMLSYKDSETGDATIDFWPGGKKIAFMGDSVTYGASPYDANDVEGDERIERPWPETVGQLLKTPTINLGKNSATLMVGTTYKGNPTPLALVRDYVNYSDDYDIVGFMIGINDLYRSAYEMPDSPYTLGTMEDRTADTFYGALHVFIKGMIAKYPPHEHKVFAMIYPYYHGNDDNRDRVPLYFNAIREVARYHALPVLDLEAELGVNALNDPGLANGTDGVYWVKTTNSHPTQAGADLIAQVVANFINTKFLLKSATGGTDGKGYVLTEDDKTDIAEKVEIPAGEVWTFELEDGSSVTKEVVVK